MRLFVLGANGRTGMEIIDLARTRGHEVTAFVRSPQKLRPASSLRSFVAILAAQKLSQLRFPDTTQCCQRSAHIHVTRFARVRYSQIARVPRWTRWPAAALLVSPLFPLPCCSRRRDSILPSFDGLLKHHARDLCAMEDIVQASGLAWTIARPPRLTKSPDASFRALREALPPGSWAMSYRSVAAFLLDAVERRSHVTEIVGLAHGLGWRREQSLHFPCSWCTSSSRSWDSA